VPAKLLSIGLRKIVKKHDKKTGIEYMSVWKSKIESAYFHTSKKLDPVTVNIGLACMINANESNALQRSCTPST
jgi:SPX domain protein involved in polyphosphate accumulation